MEVTDLSDLLNVRAIKMENAEVTFDETTDGVETSDPLSVIPQFVSEHDLALMQPGEILQAPLAVFSDVPDEDDTMQSSDSSEEVIIQLMDIRTQLSKLRTMLEQRLSVDLSEYTFWLQDAKMLESHKTLVEQCIRGSGVVQVNIQLKPAEKKINILDVLKPDEELVQLPKDVVDVGELVESVQEDEPVPTPPPASPPPEPASSHAAAVKWVVDNQLHSTSRIKLPEDPAAWSIQHVKIWIQWAVRQFNLKGVKLSDWSISGQRLTNMTNAEFKMKVPSDPGDLFWTHFELLRKCKFIAVIQQESEESESLPNTATPLSTPSKEPAKEEVHSAIKKKKPKVILGSEPDSLTCFGRSSTGGQVQLWQFLLELLTTAEYYDIIRWNGPDGEFILLEPEKVARLWGARKHKPLMNYEKLSRALRYYYDGDMIAKVACRRFVYKFVCDLRQLLGYDATELAERVRRVVDKNNMES